MYDPWPMARRGIATVLTAAATMLPFGAVSTDVNVRSGFSALPYGTVLATPAFSPLFASALDAQVFWERAVPIWLSPAPDARAMAKAFIKEQLGIDGDAHVVAHFATPQMRSDGLADRAILLTDALMQAFPEHSRHTFFGALADGMSGLSGGGEQSPGALQFVESIVTCKTAETCFTRIGRFLWSRTGPGYVYNTFIAKGNVREVAHEDMRPLDEAFGIYPLVSTFLPGDVSSLKLSQAIDKFKEEGLFSELPYIKRLKQEFDTYWSKARADWPLLARYRFVHEARRARGLGQLTQAQYERAMKGGAPGVPLDGPITLKSLRSKPPLRPVRVRRFDINGYPASDIVRFIDTDGSEVMYIPGATSPFVAFGSESELRQWVVRQAGDRASLDELLSHFSLYDRQDGVFWTGVAQSLSHLADATWKPDSATIDQGDAVIAGDVFEDMRAQVEERQRDDARMQTRTAWDGWRVALRQTAVVLGPLGYAPPLAIPVQAGSALLGLGTGLDQAVHGRTAEERTSGLEQATMTVVTSVAIGTSMGTRSTQAAPSEEPLAMTSTAARPPSLQRINGRIGYLLGPPTGPRLPVMAEDGETGQTLRLAESPAEDESPRLREFDTLASSDARQPPSPRDVQEQGYLVMAVPGTFAERTRHIIDLKKIAIDEMRHRLEDFRTDSLMTTPMGSRVSFDQSLVYRVDDRTPQELLAYGGFGPSSRFYAVSPMLRQPSTIGSGSLQANNLAFRYWQRTLRREEKYHQYTVWTDGRAVAAGADNRHRISYGTPLDEVHFPADVPAENIYIIDSFDPVFADAIAKIYESKFVSTPYGVPLKAFVDYLSGQLDINSPNPFTEQRPTFDPLSQPAAPSGSGSMLTIPHQPLSSSETSGAASASGAPLIPLPSRFSTGRNPAPEGQTSPEQGSLEGDDVRAHSRFSIERD